VGLITDLPLSAAAIAAMGLGYRVWRELPERRMKQLDYLERLRAASRSRRDGEDSRRRSGGWR